MQYGRIRRGMQGEEQLYVNGRSEDCQPADGRRSGPVAPVTG
jgi:hypothetical protein